MKRRNFVLAVLAAASTAAWAQSERFPSKPIKIIVPFAPGGGGDSIARLLASKLTDTLATSVIVENRVGASGNIGTEAALKSPPDGYTLLAISGTYASQAVATKLSYDPISGITPITQLTQETSALVVNAKSPIDTLSKLIARAKAEPGKLSYGSAGPGGLAHFSTEYLAMRAGIELNHIPYKGTGAALNDLLGGQIDIMFGGTASMASQVRAGRVRALAVTGNSRSRALPEVPTFDETGLQWDIPPLWHAIVGPRGLPASVSERLVAGIQAALATKEVKERLTAEGLDVVPQGPDKLMALIKSDIARWKAAAQAIGYKPE